MAKNTRIFKDFDIGFTANPVTKDIYAKFDENAIKTSIKNLLLTRHYERPFHSEIGSNLSNLLFELASPATAAIARQEIFDVIENFEPRVEIIDINAEFSLDSYYMNITLQFKIRNTQKPITLEFTLDRTR